MVLILVPEGNIQITTPEQLAKFMSCLAEAGDAVFGEEWEEDVL
jgi:hypothetical protein